MDEKIIFKLLKDNIEKSEIKNFINELLNREKSNDIVIYDKNGKKKLSHFLKFLIDKEHWFENFLPIFPINSLDDLKEGTLKNKFLECIGKIFNKNQNLSNLKKDYYLTIYYVACVYFLFYITIICTEIHTNDKYKYYYYCKGTIKGTQKDFDETKKYVKNSIDFNIQKIYDFTFERIIESHGKIIKNNKTTNLKIFKEVLPFLVILRDTKVNLNISFDEIEKIIFSDIPDFIICTNEKIYGIELTTYNHKNEYDNSAKEIEENSHLNSLANTLIKKIKNKNIYSLNIIKKFGCNKEIEIRYFVTNGAFSKKYNKDYLGDLLEVKLVKVLEERLKIEPQKNNDIEKKYIDDLIKEIKSKDSRLITFFIEIF